MTISKAKADYIRAMADGNGHIEPKAVVNEARDPRSILHDEFEWDVHKASEAHWMETARALIRFVKLEVEIERQTILAPYYVVDPSRAPKSKRFIQLNIAARDQKMARRVMQDELDRIVAAIRRAQDVAAVLGLSDAFEEFLDAWKELKTKSERMKEEKAKAKARKGKGPQRRRGQQPELRA